MHPCTMNRYIYIYISSHLPSCFDMHQMYIRISFARVRNRSSLLVRFVSQNWFKLFLFIYLLPISNFSLFRFHTKRLPLFDHTVENACLNVDLMGATTTVATTTTTTTTLPHLPIFRFISAIEKDNVVLRDKKLVRFDGKKQKKKKTHTKKRQVLLCICGILRQIHAVKIRQRQVVG